MKKLVFIPAVILILGFSKSFAQVKYSLDVSKSEIVWVGKKITGQHKGNILVSKGEFTIDKDKNISEGSFEIDMASITDVDLTDKEYNTKLVGHLKSPDFFDVQKFPKASFVVNKICKIDKGNCIVKGNMTLKDVTLPFEFKAVLVTFEDGYKIFSNFSIDRSKFGIKYGSGTFFGDLGDKTIYDDFDLFLNLLARKSVDTTKK